MANGVNGRVLLDLFHGFVFLSYGQNGGQARAVNYFTLIRPFTLLTRRAPLLSFGDWRRIAGGGFFIPQRDSFILGQPHCDAGLFPAPRSFPLIPIYFRHVPPHGLPWLTL